jgi:hypothetical protein
MSKNFPDDFFSEDFKNLIEGMLHDKPKNRYNIEDI